MERRHKCLAAMDKMRQRAENEKKDGSAGTESQDKPGSDQNGADVDADKTFCPDHDDDGIKTDKIVSRKRPSSSGTSVMEPSDELPLNIGIFERASEK